MDLQKDGDLLEREFAEFIGSSLSGYQKIWAEFIGNNGLNEPASVRGVAFSQPEEQDRTHTGQHIYTVLEGVLCLQRLVSRNVSTTATSADDALDVADLMLVFHAHLGRIRDQVQKLGAIWKIHDLASELEEFYQRRNSVLHGAKVPFSVAEGSSSSPFRPVATRAMGMIRLAGYRSTTRDRAKARRSPAQVNSGPPCGCGPTTLSP